MIYVVQGEASFTQRLFLRPGCQGNEFETEFLLCTINSGEFSPCDTADSGI